MPPVFRRVTAFGLKCLSGSLGAGFPPPSYMQLLMLSPAAPVARTALLTASPGAPVIPSFLLPLSSSPLLLIAYVRLAKSSSVTLTLTITSTTRCLDQSCTVPFCLRSLCVLRGPRRVELLIGSLSNTNTNSNKIKNIVPPPLYTGLLTRESRRTLVWSPFIQC